MTHLKQINIQSLRKNVIYSDRAQRMPDKCENTTAAWLLDNQLSLLEMSLLILFWELYLHMKRRFLNLQRVWDAISLDLMTFQLFFIWKPMSDSRDIFVCACMCVCLNISGCFQYLWNRGRTVCASRSEFQLKEFMLICFCLCNHCLSSCSCHSLWIYSLWFHPITKSLQNSIFNIAGILKIAEGKMHCA